MANSKKSFLNKLGLGNEQVSKNLLILLSIFLFMTLIVMLFAIFVLQNFLTSSYLTQKQKQDRFFYWMGRVEEFPNSPDVLYNAAVSAYEIDKNETSLRLLKRATEKDPLFDEAKELQEEIVEKVK